MKWSHLVALGSFAGLLASSCSSEPTHIGFELRAGTFNAGLAPAFAPLVAERTEPVINALTSNSSSLDVLCVQEFWLAEHWQALAASVASELPHALRLAPRPGTGSCSAEELGALGQCLQTACPDASGENLVACATTNCAAEVTALNPGCLS